MNRTQLMILFIGYFALLSVIITYRPVWDYFKMILIDKDHKELRWYNKIVGWVVIWIFLIGYIPYKIVEWFQEK